MISKIIGILLGSFFFIKLLNNRYFAIDGFGSVMENIIRFTTYFFPLSYCLYLIFRPLHVNTSGIRRGTKIFLTILFSGMVLLWTILKIKDYPEYGFISILKIVPPFLLLYGSMLVIWKKNVMATASVFNRAVLRICFFFILFMTALSYEVLFTPILPLVLVFIILLWFIQIILVKKIFLRETHLRTYILYNITSPFWSLWINGYKNEGSGSHNYFGFFLYIVLAILFVAFIMEEKSEDCSEIKTIEQNTVIKEVTTPNGIENKEDKLIRVMVKILIGLIIALFVLLATSYYIKSKQPPYNEVVYGNTEVKVKYLTGDMLQFVKENYPQESKRLFVYIPEMEDVTCPYMQDFVQGLKQAKSNSKWTSSYHFMPSVNRVTANSRAEAEKKVEQVQKFTENVCGNLCIIDTQENWVFEIKRGDLIPISLETFKK